jgi:hypothetical protein
VLPGLIEVFRRRLPGPSEVLPEEVVGVAGWVVVLDGVLLVAGPT